MNLYLLTTFVHHFYITLSSCAVTCFVTHLKNQKAHFSLVSLNFMRWVLSYFEAAFDYYHFPGICDSLWIINGKLHFYQVLGNLRLIRFPAGILQNQFNNKLENTQSTWKSIEKKFFGAWDFLWESYFPQVVQRQENPVRI